MNSRELSNDADPCRSEQGGHREHGAAQTETLGPHLGHAVKIGIEPRLMLGDVGREFRHDLIADQDTRQMRWVGLAWLVRSYAPPSSLVVGSLGGLRCEHRRSHLNADLCPDFEQKVRLGLTIFGISSWCSVLVNRNAVLTRG